MFRRKRMSNPTPCGIKFGDAVLTVEGTPNGPRMRLERYDGEAENTRRVIVAEHYPTTVQIRHLIASLEQALA